MIAIAVGIVEDIATAQSCAFGVCTGTLRLRRGLHLVKRRCPQRKWRCLGSQRIIDSKPFVWPNLRTSWPRPVASALPTHRLTDLR